MLGRFLQADPIGYSDDMNLYASVGGNPINLIDPTGLKLDVVLFGPWDATFRGAMAAVSPAGNPSGHRQVGPRSNRLIRRTFLRPELTFTLGRWSGSYETVSCRPVNFNAELLLSRPPVCWNRSNLAIKATMVQRQVRE